MSQAAQTVQINNYLRDVLTVPAAFSAQEVAAVLSLVPSLPAKPGVVGEGQVRSSRRSSIQWIHEDVASQWLYAKMNALFHFVNQKYGFDIRGFGDKLQVARYEEGNYYDWHMDIGKGQSSTRKISISIQLSDPADYEGGDLDFFGMPDFEAPRGLGTAIAFPTFLPHQVKPVTRGVRFSLVTWIAGPPFR